MSSRRISLAIGTTAAVSLAAALGPLAAAPIAYAGTDGGSALLDTVLMSQTNDLDLLAGMAAAADSLVNTPQIPDLAAFGPESLASVSDPGFISNVHDFGLFTLISAADPDDDFIAFAIQTPLFTDILTSGADPEGSLGLGDASIGLAGATVNTFESSVFPFLDSSFTLPFPDPFADLFTLLVQLGF